MVACNALHELALSDNKTNKENKKLMFEEFAKVTSNLRKSGLFIICFIEYKKKATDKEIEKHLWIAEHTIGHDHPRDEFFSIREIKNGLRGMKLIETRRKLQTHRYKNHVDKTI